MPSYPDKITLTIRAVKSVALAPAGLATEVFHDVCHFVINNINKIISAHPDAHAAVITYESLHPSSTQTTPH